MQPRASRLSIDLAGERHLVLAGVIDLHTGDQLLDRLASLGRKADISLDLADIDFIDSSGLRTIVTTHQELEATDHRLVLTEVSDAVRRLLEITGLEEHLHMG